MFKAIDVLGRLSAWVILILVFGLLWLLGLVTVSGIYDEESSLIGLDLVFQLDLSWIPFLEYIFIAELGVKWWDWSFQTSTTALGNGWYAGVDLGPLMAAVMLQEPVNVPITYPN